MTESANDPFGGRAPTSHERMTGVPWDASYDDGPAPWDFGGPQPAIVAAAGAFTGTVLDAGCGTGENALYVASLGLPVVGVDVAETALAVAREHAAERGLDAEFVALDAFELEKLERQFDTVLDSGLLHTFDSAEKAAYARSLAAVTKPGGKLYVLCFSDAGPDTGPHPVREDELRAAFATGWTIASLEPARVRTRFHDEHGAPGWFAVLVRD